MNHRLSFLIPFVVAALPLPLLVAADNAPSATVAPIEVGRDVREAWDALQAADVKIGELIAQRRLSDLAEQTRIVKVSVETIIRGVRTTDESVLRRLVSAGREIVALADHLAEVAASGNRGRADVVHANLHKYVDFVQKRLPPDVKSQDARNPRSISR